MQIELPVKIFYNESVYDSVTLKRPSGSVLADTASVLSKTGDEFTAYLTYLSGTIEIISGPKEITDKVQIKSMLRKLAYKSAEYIGVMSAASLHDDDSIEGVYSCPRCRAQVICEQTEESDTTDKLSDLKVNNVESDRYTVEMDYPPVIKVAGNNEHEIRALTLNYPTLENCIAAAQSGVRSRMNYRIYANALLEVNGDEVDKKERQRYGLNIFEKADAKDLEKIALENRKVGLQTQVQKECPSCSKVWRATINPSNFFGSALQLEQ